MKFFLAWILLLAIASISYATTLDEVVRLSRLQTSDDLILQLLQDNPVKTSVGPADVIFLKEQGVSEEVIRYIWTAAKSAKTILPPQEGESISMGKGLRAYYVLTEDGQKQMVLTNLDENGIRMGPLPPLPSKEPAYPDRMLQESEPVHYSAQPEMPQQTYVQPAWHSYNSQTPNYTGSSYPTAGSFANYYATPVYPAAYATYYFPFYSYQPKMSFGHHFPNTPGLPNCKTPRTGQKSPR